MLRTGYVFVDTESFVNAQFVLYSGRLKRLKELAESERIQLVIPAVTRMEFDKKLRERLDEAIAAWQTARGKAQVLSLSKNPIIKGLFETLERTALEAELVGALETFLSDAKAMIIDAEDGALNRVLTAYFAGGAPFGEGKKKHEFPDAIAIDTLREWCRTEEVEVYVVSHDDGLASACSPAGPLLHLPDLKDLFSLIEAQDARAAALLDAALPKIRQEIEEKFEWSGFTLEDQDGEVAGVDVNEIKIVSARVQDVEHRRVLFEADVEISFSAEVRYDDYSTAVYDKEDDAWFNLIDIEEILERQTQLTIYGQIDATSDDLLEIGSIDVGLSTSETYPIVVDDNDPWFH